jgi:SAM-dependent methyltransferase
VGCGESLIAEMLLQRRSAFDELVLIDSSPSMLRYSNAWRQHRIDLILADAASLPLRSNAIAALVSSLGDAYNTDGFWSEVARVLTRNGVALYTTPSFEWAHAFRDEGIDRMEAEFEIADGRIVRVPSVIIPPQEQVRLIEGHGLVVKNVMDVPIRALRETVISPKLVTDHGADLSMVTGYTVTKS